MSLTISGAVSLGAYEGGALAALLYAAREIAARDDPPLCIDVMSGASAGSITALLAARALLQGYDPWVTGDSLGSLLAHGTQAPLSADALRKLGSTLLDPARGELSPRRPAARIRIRLSYTLACLRGFEYQLPRLGRGPVPAAAFIDTYDHVLSPDAPVSSLTGPRGDCPLDAVLASGANEMGFPPCLLSPGELLSQALRTASGLAGKQPARVDVISPLLLPESSTQNIDQLLSGEVLFHFGGFLDETMRRNDFDLGYSSTLQWLGRDSRLEKAGLLAMHPWQAARLTGKITQVLLHDFLHHPPP